MQISNPVVTCSICLFIGCHNCADGGNLVKGQGSVGQYTIYGDCVIQQQFIDQPFHCMLWSFLFPSNNMASGNIFSRHRHSAICGAGRIFWLAVSVQSLMWVGWGRKWSDGKMLPMQICHLVIGNWSFEQAGPGRRTQKRKRQAITILRTHSYCMKCLGKKIRPKYFCLEHFE